MVIVLAALIVHMCFLWVAGPLAQLPVAAVLGVFQMQRLLYSALTVFLYQQTSQRKQLFHALKYDTQCKLVPDSSEVMRYT